jgi:hypothetical protein
VYIPFLKTIPAPVRIKKSPQGVYSMRGYMMPARKKALCGAMGPVRFDDPVREQVKHRVRIPGQKQPDNDYFSFRSDGVFPGFGKKNFFRGQEQVCGKGLLYICPYAPPKNNADARLA